MRLLQSAWIGKKTDRMPEVLDDPMLISEIWDSIDHAEKLLEPLPAETFTDRIKIILSQVANAFAFESLGNLTPVSINPLPSLRSDAPGNMVTSASFRFAQAGIPGAVFYLMVSAESDGLVFFWQVAGNPGRIKNLVMYIDEELSDFQTLAGGSATFFLSNQMAGSVSFASEGVTKTSILKIDL